MHGSCCTRRACSGSSTETACDTMEASVSVTITATKAGEHHTTLVTNGPDRADVCRSGHGKDAATSIID